MHAYIEKEPEIKWNQPSRGELLWLENHLSREFYLGELESNAQETDERGDEAAGTNKLADLKPGIRGIQRIRKLFEGICNFCEGPISCCHYWRELAGCFFLLSFTYSSSKWDAEEARKKAVEAEATPSMKIFSTEKREETYALTLCMESLAKANLSERLCFASY